jgi:hypothetical protein
MIKLNDIVMKYFLETAVFVILLLIGQSCTPYQSMSITGGYDDSALGNGKYKIIARGNGFTAPSRVKAIAYLRAAELTKECGKSFFYVLDDDLQVSNQYVGNGLSVGKDIYQLIIQPTNNDDGLNADEINYKYTKELNLKDKKAVKEEEDPEMSAEGKEEMRERLEH